MYSDLATALIMTEASVRDLQERLPNSDVSVHNFRPNFVIDGDLQPYTEDEWDWIKIGDVVFRNVMLCGRCALTTINPETAEFSKKYEPITTMRKYRTVTKIGSGPASPTMGIYAGIKLKGIVKLKDTVYVGKH
ncbi:hypothetical protein FQA39_LY19094 [Lamprigera yunnana]|nr:hypothetical protein FQA39_LY19094 [Lamprigera yunnana]